MSVFVDLYIDNECKRIDLDSYGKEVISFGRNSECDIYISKEFVSRLHGCFYKENGKWNIKDLESTNGIYTSGRRIDQSEIYPGQTFEIYKKADDKNRVRFLIGKEDVSANGNTYGKNAIREESSSTPIIIITVIVAVILLGLIIFAFIKFSNDDKDKKEKTTTTTEVTTASPTSASTEETEETTQTTEESTETTQTTEEPTKDTEETTQTTEEQTEEPSEESGNDKSTELSEQEQKYLDAIKKYCYLKNPALKDMSQDDYSFGWDIQKIDENIYEVTFRSYTGSKTFYKIDALTGNVTTEELVPAISDERMPSDDTFNINDYID